MESQSSQLLENTGLLNADHLRALNHAHEVLWSDLGTTRNALQKDYESQYLRRQLVRGFCTFTETHIFYLKSNVLFIRELVFQILCSNMTAMKPRLHEFFSVEFPLSEIQILLEENAEVDDAGSVRASPKFIKAARNIRFAQSSYLRTLKTGLVVDYGHHGWCALKEVIKLRNQLTHPKSEADLSVSDAAINQMIQANDWFGETSHGIIAAGIKRLEEFVALQNQFGGF